MKLKITIDDRTYDVEVEAVEPEVRRPPRGYMIEPSRMNVPAAAAHAPAVEPVRGEEKVCRSPVSGIVVRLVAQPGQTVQSGDVLLVLEAMKMETNITAPLEGKVAAMRAHPGDSVQVGQVVVEFE